MILQLHNSFIYSGKGQLVGESVLINFRGGGDWLRKDNLLLGVFFLKILTLHNNNYVTRALSTFARVKNHTFARKMTHLPGDF